MNDKANDVFICHASEDKKQIVYPILEAFKKNEISYWIDNEQIEWGDSIPKKINYALLNYRFFLVVLSPAFIKKAYPNNELMVAINKCLCNDKQEILVLLVGTEEEKQHIRSQYPPLSDKLFHPWDGKISLIVDKINTKLLNDNQSSNTSDDKLPPEIQPTSKIVYAYFTLAILWVILYLFAYLASDDKNKYTLYVNAIFQPGIDLISFIYCCNLFYIKYQNRTPLILPLSLLMSTMGSLLFISFYHIYNVIYDTQYPTWSIGFWILYIVFLSVFWIYRLRNIIKYEFNYIINISIIVGIGILLVLYPQYHDLLEFKTTDQFRKATYAISGVFETIAIIVLVCTCFVLREERWLSWLCIAQGLLISLDTVFCNVEYNNQLETFKYEPWEALWTIFQFIACGIILYKGSLLFEISSDLSFVEIDNQKLIGCIAIGAFILWIAGTFVLDNVPFFRSESRGPAIWFILTVFNLYCIKAVPLLARSN